MTHKAVRYASQRTATAAGVIAGAASSATAAAASSATAAALAASIILSPAADASSRLDGVHADLQRAVELNQITEEQALRFEAKLAGRIFGAA